MASKRASTQHPAMAIAAVTIVPSLHLLLKFFKSGMSYDSEVRNMSGAPCPSISRSSKFADSPSVRPGLPGVI